jgi:hypothetical protein
MAPPRKEYRTRSDYRMKLDQNSIANEYNKGGVQNDMTNNGQINKSENNTKFGIEFGVHVL